MPMFEFEKEVTIDDAWNGSTVQECDEFFYRILEWVYLTDPKSREKIKKLLDAAIHKDIMQQLKERKEEKK